MDDLKRRHKELSTNFHAAEKIADQILEDPNIRGYLIDVAFLVCERYGTVTHPQDILAVLSDEDE